MAESHFLPADVISRIKHDPDARRAFWKQSYVSSLPGSEPTSDKSSKTAKSVLGRSGRCGAAYVEALIRPTLASATGNLLGRLGVERLAQPQHLWGDTDVDV
jgi:hypothetical protein